MSTILKQTAQTAPRAWRFYRARPSALLMALLAVFGSSAGISFAQNVIVPKGTTTTRLVVNGNVTDITTGTIQGGAALNTFNRFEVDRNNTVNLIVPSAANVLLNLVTDAPVTVHGVVNSLKDGKIGGNVVFADPFGMIVGSSGALNVGSLLVTTPTRAFIDGVIGTDGTIDALSVSALLGGTAPASGLGVIRIDGKVNARDAIRLRGSDVTVNGALRAGADMAHEAAFLGAVNADAVAGGAALVESNGVIEIVASGDAALGGRLSTDGNGSAGGRIDVHAGHDLAVAPGAAVTARGQGAHADGGNITLVGGHDAVLGNGARVDAGAGSSGDGGAVEFSAVHKVTIDGGVLSAGATAGRGGHVLIDPATIEWHGSGNDRLVTDGSETTLVASESILLDDVVISSRKVDTHGAAVTRANIGTFKSNGDSGNITLKAPSIMLQGGTQLLAFDDRAAAPAANTGVVLLEASSTVAKPALGTATATSSVTVGDATIHANAVSMTAQNTVESRYVYHGDDPVTVAAGLATAGAMSTLTLGADVAGLDLVFSDVHATASVMLNSGSTIVARGTAALTATNDTKAGVTHGSLNGVPGASAYGIGAAWASNASSATVTVAAGASITADDLAIRAHNTASVASTIKAPNIPDAGQDAVSIAFGGTHADVKAHAGIAAGATVHVAKSVSVAATNVGSFVNETEAETGAEGKGVAAIAYAQHNSSATAALNANVGDAASVSVIAVDDVQKDAVSAKSSVGASQAGNLGNQLAANTLVRAEMAMFDKLGLGSRKLKDPLTPSDANGFRIGGAVAVVDNSHTANASIGAGAKVHASDAALVAARVTATDVQVGASSAAVSQSADNAKAGTARNGYSAGVVFSDITHEATATVGDGAEITAPKIAVGADTIVPQRTALVTGTAAAVEPLTRWNSADDVANALSSLASAADLFNGSASAKAGGDGTPDSKGIYGSVQILQFNERARAEIGSGAALHVSGHAAVTDAAPWNTKFVVQAAHPADGLLGLTGSVPEIAETFSYAAPATVAAHYAGTYWFLAGQMPGSGSDKGLGASIGQVSIGNDVRAIVREGAVIDGVDEHAGTGTAGTRSWTSDAVRAADDVAVRADNDLTVYSLATAGGVGGSFGLNGTLVYNALDGHTEALIDDEATVRAVRLALNATGTPVLWSIAGSLNYASASSIGAGLAINDVDATTRAEIADNDTLSTDGAPRASRYTATGSPTTMFVRDLQVLARKGGAVNAISAAGSLAWNSPDTGPGFVSKMKGYYDGAIAAASEAIDTVTFKQKVQGPAPQPKPAAAKKDDPSFTLAGAGSASVNRTDMRTSARIDGVRIDQGADGAAHALAVRAIADADIRAGSGAAGVAIGTKDSSTRSYGVAGAVALNLLGNGTSAQIDNTTVNNAGDVAVQALTGGEQLAVGIAPAISVSGGQTTSSNQLVGSISVTQTLAGDDGVNKNFAHAGIGASTITALGTAGAGGTAPALDVTAYNRAFIGTGGGSLALKFGGSASDNGKALGVAFSYADIRNDVTAGIDGGTINTFRTVGVRAFDATEIAAGAAYAGGSTQPEGSSYAGATVVSLVSNTTTATIGGGATVEATDSVTVKAADSGADASLEHLIDPSGKRNNVAPGLDYCGQQVGGSAPSGSCITSVAGMLQATSGSNYGVSLGVNQIANHTAASIGAATVKATGTAGTIDVLADAKTNILGITAGVGVSKKLSGAGSLSFNFVDNTVSAHVGDTAAAAYTANLQAASIAVKASDDSQVKSFAGQVSAAKGKAIGAALTVNVSHGAVDAGVAHADLTAANAITVQGTNGAKVDSLAVAGALASGDTAIAGSIAVNLVQDSTDAALRDTTTNTALPGAPGNTVTVGAADVSRIRSLSGSAAISDKSGAGAAFSFNGIDNASRAVIDTSTLTNVDALALSGTLASTVDSAAAALGVGIDGAALAGSVTINQIGLAGNVASAMLTGSTVTAGKVQVTAADDSHIDSLAGTVSGGKTAIGAAIADNGIATTVTARIQDASVKGAQTVDVGAASTAAIQSAAAAGGGGSSAAIDGSSASNHIYNKTYGEIVDGEITGGSARVGVSADDNARIDALSGAVAGAGTGAGSGALAVNLIGGAGHTQTAQARVSGARAGTAGLDVGNLIVAAHSAGATRTLAVAGAFAGEGAVGGSVVTNVVARDVAAFIDGGAKVKAADNVGVLASGNDTSAVIAGAAAVSGEGGSVGISSVFNQIDGSVRAYIDGAATKVDALAANAGDTITVNTGELRHPVDVDSIKEPPAAAADLSERTAAVRGVAVNATSHQSVNNIAVTASLSGGVGIVVNPVVNLMGGDTQAYIHGAKINTASTPAAGADVNVLASSHGFAGDFVTGLAGGPLAAAGAASANRTDRDTSAYITDATIGRAATRETTDRVDTAYHATGAVGDDGNPVDSDQTTTSVTTTTYRTRTLAPSVGAVNVRARSSQATADIVAGLAAGLGAGTGTATLTIFGGTTAAYVERGALTAGSLAVDARSSDAYNMLAGAGAVGAVGMSGAFGVGIAAGRTDAHVGDRNVATPTTSLDLAGALSVTARTDGDFNALAVSGSAGGFGAIAGSVAVTVVQNETVAGVYNTRSAAAAPSGSVQTSSTDGQGNTVVTTDRTGSGLLADAPGAVTVAATESIKVKPKAGGVAVGGLAAGAGAGANVVVVKSSVTGEIVGSTIDDARAVAVTATSDKQVDMAAASGAAGATAGIGGSVGVLVVGSADKGGANDELDRNGSGTLSQVNTLTSKPLATKGATPEEQGAAPTFDVKSAVNGLRADAVTARIAGGSVKGDTVAVNAQATTATKNVAGALALGGGLGAGGAVGVSRVFSNVDASIDAATVTTGGIDVSALAQDGSAGKSAAVTTYAGAAGLVGLGAAVADARVQNQVTAHADGVFTGTGAGSMRVAAADNARVDATGVGAAAGAAAVGVVVSQAEKSSSVGADAGSGSRVAGFGDLAVIGGAGVATDGSTDPFVQAAATGAAGGLLAAGAGAQAVAVNHTHVNAAIGDDVALPDGNVTIAASNDSRQLAHAAGTSGAGLVAASGAVARAESGSSGDRASTTATLGDRASTGANRAGYLLVKASGVDANTATATAAAGGVVAGNASQASTADYATVRATVGSGANVHAGAVTVSADHLDSHYDHADSLNASVIGGSGANAAHVADVNVAAVVRDGSTLAAAGNLQVLADNMFDNGSHAPGESASGAGGGVINGAAAGSTTDVTAHTNVTLGDNVNLSSGPSAGAEQYTLLLRAANYTSLSDTVKLGTGGAIAGAGVSAHTTANLNSDVATGLGDQITSLGSIGIGSYANAAASASALVETHGVAAVGTADASTDIAANQSVRIGGGNSLIRGFGNVDVTAGKDPTGYYNTVLNGNASAQGYVKGLIAVPTASAATTLTSNASLDIARGASVESGQNAVVGAYQGASNAVADGTGHGYELGFIPVTAGHDSTATPSSANVTIDGNVAAGIYHDLRITIDNCANSGAYCATVNKSANSAPTTIAFDPYFDAAAFVNQNFLDPATRGLMLSGVASGPVGAVKIGALYAAGGTVTVNAGSLQGGGSLSSYGAPKIEVVNNSPDYVVVGSATIPNTPGGEIMFSGTAGRATALANHMGLTETGAGEAATVSIRNEYTGNAGAPQGPALMLMGDVTNLGGKIDIVNRLGSIGQNAGLLGQQVNVLAPNGVYVAEIPDSSGPYYAGSNPYAEWQQAMIWPGGNPASGAPSADWAVAYVASSWETGSHANVDAFNASFIHGPGALKGDNFSRIWYGGSFRHQDGEGTASANSPLGQSFRLIGDQGDTYIAKVPLITELTRTVQNYPAATTAASAKSAQILGSQVAVHAKYIDINGKISVGQPTDWSVSLPAALKSNLDNATLLYRVFGGAPTIDIPAAQLGLADALIGATFDIPSQTIILKNVNASSGGGSLSLKGQILSTNTLGNIHVNGGFGKVAIDNQTGYTVKVQDINAGSGALLAGTTGKVEIIDTTPNAGRHVLYTYTPGGGVKQYSGAVNQTAEQLALVSEGTPGTTAATYATTPNQRWEWTETADLSRSISFANGGWTVVAGNWQFTGNRNDPWRRSTGRVVQGAAGGPAFTETISGDVLSQTTSWFGYGGCDNAGKTFCNYGFRQTDDFVPQGGQPWRGWWKYLYPTYARLTLTSSVKADNAIKIDFTGNATGSVSINSNGAVQLAGQIINPSGTTTIQAGGALTQAPKATLSTHDLTLKAGSGIGTAQAAFGATMGTSGLLNAATAAGGIYLDLNGGATLVAVTAGSRAAGYGDVRIAAHDSLLAASTGVPNIQGSDITLTSSQGAIGSGAAPLVISAIGNAGVNGALGGVVNVEAHGDVGLRQVGGDLLVGRIASTANGDVTIDVPNGTIYDARGQTAANTLSESQVKQVWDSLDLLHQSKGTALTQDASVKAYQAKIGRDYQDYWNMRRLGTVDAQGVLVLTADGIAALRPVLAAGGSDLDVQTLAAKRFGDLRAGLDEAFAGTSSAATWQTAPYKADFTYTASAQRVAALTDRFDWTTSELSYAVRRSALEPASSQQVGNASANIVGHAVSITTGTAIGKLAPAVDVALADLNSGNLRDVQKAALGIAKTPGDIRLVGIDQQGHTVVYDYGKQPAGVTLTGFRLAQTSPLFIDATGAISLKAGGGAVYLQGTGTNRDLQIGQVSAATDVNLTAPQSIVVATDTNGAPRAPVQIVAGGDVRLTGGSGNLGSAANPLAIQAGGILQLATAGQSMFLKTPSGDLRLGALAAGSLVRLDAPTGSILAANDNAGLTIRGHDIVLNAAIDLGAANNPLRVSVGDVAGGKLDGSAGRNAWFVSPNAADRFGIGTLDVGGSIDLNAAGDLAADHLVAGGAIVTHAADTTIGQADGDTLAFTADGDLALDTALARGTIDLAATGMLRLAGGLNTYYGSIVATAGSLAMGIDASIGGGSLVRIATGGDAVLTQVVGADLDISAGGKILGGAAGSFLMAYGDGFTPGSTALFGVGGIGATGAALGVRTSDLMARSPNGDLVLDLWGNTRASILESTHGALAVTAHDRLDAFTVRGATVALTAEDLAAVEVEATSGNADITTAATASINTLTANNNATVQGAGTVAIGQLFTGADAALSGTDVTVASAIARRDLHAEARGTLVASTLDAAGDAVLAGADVRVGSVHAGRDLAATAGATLRADALAAARALTVTTEGDASIKVATAGTDAAIAVHAGSLTGDRVQAGTLDAAAGRALTLNRADVAGTAGLRAGNALALGSLQSGADATLAAGTTATLGTLDARHGGTLAVTSGGAQTVTAATAGGDIVLQGASLHLGSANAGRDLRIATSGRTDLVSGSAGAAVDLAADSAGFGTLAAGTTAHLATVTGDLAGTALTAGAIDVHAGRDAMLRTVQGRGDAALAAGRLLDVATLTAGGDAALVSGAATHLGTVHAGRDLAADAGASLQADDLAAGRALRLTAGDDARFQTLQAGGAATLAATRGNLTGDRITAGMLDAGAGGAIALNRADVGGTTDMQAGSNLTLGALQSAGDATVTAGTDATLHTAASQSTLTVKSGGALAVDTATGGTNVVLRAASAHIGTAQAGLGIIVNTVGAQGADLLDAGRNVVVRAGTAATVQQVRAAHLLDVEAGSADIGGAVAGTGAQLQTTGNLTAGTVDAGYLFVTAGGDTAIGRMNADARAEVQAGGAVAIDSLTVNGTAAIEAGGNATLHTAHVRGDLTVTSGGVQTLDRIAANGDVVLQGAGLALGNAYAGRDLRATLGGRADVTTAQAGRDVDLSATAAGFGTIEAGGSARLVATADDLTGTTLTAATAAVTAGHAVTLQQVSAGGDAVIGAGTRLDVAALDAGGDATLAAGTDARLGAVQAGRDLAVNAGAGLHADALAAGRSLLLTTVGDAQFGTLAAGADATLAAQAGNLTGDRLAAGTLAAQASGNVNLDRADVGGTTDVQAGASLALGTLQSGADATLTAGTTATLGTIGAGTSALPATLAVTSGGALTVDAAAASRDVVLRAAAAQIGTAQAGRDVDAGTSGALRADLLAAGADLRANAGDAMAIATATAGGTLDLQAATAHVGALTAAGDARLAAGTGALGVDTLDAGTLAATAGGDVTLGQAVVHGVTAIGASGAVAADRLTVAGNAAVDAGTNVTLRQATTDGDLAVTSGVAQALGTVAAGGDVVLRGATLALDKAKAGRTLRAAMNGRADVTAALAGTDVELTAASAGFGTLAAGGTAHVVTTAGDLTGTTLRAATVDVTSQGTATLQQVASSGDTAIAAGTRLDVAALDAGRDALLTAGTDARLGTVQAGRDLGMDAGASLHADDLVAGRALHLASVGDAQFGSAAAGADATLRVRAGSLAGDRLAANTLAADAVGAIQLNRTDVGATADVHAGAGLTLGSLQSGGDTTLTAGTTAVLGTVDVGTTAAPATLAVTSGGALSIDAATASRDVALHAASARIGTLAAGADARLATTGNLGVDTLGANTLAATAGGEAAFTQADVRGAAAIAGAGNVTLGTVNVGTAGQGADLAVDAGAALTAGTVKASRDVRLHAAAVTVDSVAAQQDLALRTDAGSLRYNRLAAGRDVAIAAASDVTGAGGSVLTSARDVRIDAASLAFDGAAAGRDFRADVAHDVTGNTLQSGGDLHLGAGGSIDVVNLRAGRAADLTAGGTMRVGTLRSASLSAGTPGTLSMDVLSDAGQVQVAAGTIAMKVASGGPRFAFDVTGWRGGVADKVTLDIDAPAGTTFPHLRAKDAEVRTTSDSNNYGSGYITGTLRFTNPSGQMYMNNVAPASVPGTVLQLVQPTFAFTLVQEGLFYYTDAYVTQYAPQYRPFVPDHQESRVVSTVLSYGASAAATIGSVNEQVRAAPAAMVPTLPRQPQAQERPHFDTEGGDVPVNWGDKVTAVHADDIQFAADGRATQD